MFLNSLPSPPWGRGWLATGAFISRGGPGEGVKTVNSEGMTSTSKLDQPRRHHRSIARSVKLIDRARNLRQTATETEQTAWRLLRTLRFRGFKFRRQVPIDQYIVDFYCPQRRLVVELDGSVHGQPSQAKQDLRRDAHLKNLGYAVARFPNGMVVEAPELFVDKVMRLAGSLPEAFGNEA